MSLDEYVTVDDKQLRMGYTTGSCAAGAAKAAACMLVTGQEIPEVTLMTPKGILLHLEIEEIKRGENSVSCAVRKDSGDDPDVTNGTLVYALVERTEKEGIEIDGGLGIGRVTKPGLDQPVGNAAINSTPRRMIREAVEEEVKKAPGERCGYKVTISIPAGVELAARTFNPKLGIVGGISVLGTTGIVEPMSEDALLATIRTEINVRKEEGFPILPAAPGNYGRSFMHDTYGFDLTMAAASSNYIYETVRMAETAGFTRMLFIGHIGKLVKVAGGVKNTHSKYGDRRMEILTTLSEACREEGFLPEGPEAEQYPGNPYEGLPEALAECVSTDEAIRILRERGLSEKVMEKMTAAIQKEMEAWADHKIRIEIVVFSNVYGELGLTAHAREYMDELRVYTEHNL